ncbi:tripartite motif-containing protein 14 [Gouania willdenowi]|uniref:Tripartite motif-containing protein 14-like n=1 Tax=Gouania willdenowi TaxID=441366 RepID=A0A8C5ELY4_GOUWI|nr:tripartite motif-containing protein 14-like [Gouania willdenowi]
MGASLDTPAVCPLCNELTQDLFTLKCNHRFCRRCIGDLWSINTSGPYRCPEFRCKTVYQSLPFDRRTHPNSSKGDACSGEENTSDPLLRGSSLSRFLGKRKATTSVSGQPNAKRSSVGSSRVPFDIEAPSVSFSDVLEHETKRASFLGSTQFKFSDDPSSTGKSHVEEIPASDFDGPADVSVQQVESEAVMLIDDTDSSNEVDLCDSALFSIPKRGFETSVTHISPKKPGSSANFDRSAGAQHFGGAITMTYSKSPEAASGCPSNVCTIPVLCHYCPKTGSQTAVKTCLVCGASMCKEHLRPHLDSPVFQNHTLVSPMEDISLWRCQEHQEINRIYCRQCALCVCTVCTVIGSHRDHVCISIREAERELRENLKEKIKELQTAEQQVSITVSELTQTKETCRVVLKEASAGVKQQYGAIREALEQEEQLALHCVEKEQKRVVGSLEEKLFHLQSSLQSIQKGLHMLEALSDTKGDKRIQDQAFIMEYTKVAQITTGIGNVVHQSEPPGEVNGSLLRCLQRWTEKRLDSIVITLPGTHRDLYRLLYGFVPSLDADTAHPKLLLSDNNRKVTYSELQQPYTDHVARFTSFPQVLSSSCLEGGRWYWEVSMSVDDGRWKVGLSEAGIERKGQRDNSRLGFNSYSWCLSYDRKKVETLHNKLSVPVEVDGLQRVGLFLDFEEGILSFFNVTPEGVALLHSFKHSFTEPLYPALSVSKTQLTICDLYES